MLISSRTLYLLLHHAIHSLPTHTKREIDHTSPQFKAFAALIPILVCMSGLFAGLTLGYMSLDETQLSVLSISGTPKQREYANKIMPIRKNGHLLLVTLLLANMIVNETLPVISEPVLGGGLQGVVIAFITDAFVCCDVTRSALAPLYRSCQIVSRLTVTKFHRSFAEIIPQSLFTRHGLYLGAKMATLTKCLILVLGIIAWPVAKLLEWVLGPHHGIIYRRAELKELIALHSSSSPHGGDLKGDTVTIIGATLDLQEKVVRQAMTPIEDVFMLSIDSKLDYDLLKKIVQTGHSRVPVYEEIEVQVPVSTLGATERTQKVKKILGMLLVKQCVMLDPKDATPLRKMSLNKVPFVPNNEPLLGILDKFQEGRSHMAIAMSVKKAAKRSLTQRLRMRVGMGDSDSDDESEESSDEESHGTSDGDGKLGREKEVEAEEDAYGVVERDFGTPGRAVRRPRRARGRERRGGGENEKEKDGDVEEPKKTPRSSFQLPRAAASMASMSGLEQSMPADAVLGKEDAEENFDPAVMPLGIITLEDVLEGNAPLPHPHPELIGEEIYDEFDPQGARGDPYHLPPPTPVSVPVSAPAPASSVHVQPEPVHAPTAKPGLAPLHVPTALKSLGSLGFLRSRSAPPVPRDQEGAGTGAGAGAGDDEREREREREKEREKEMSMGAQGQIVEQRPALLHIPASHTPAPAPAPESLKPESLKPAASPPAAPAAAVGLAVPMPISNNPPLEAVLLDRKRRMVGSAGGAGAGVVGDPMLVAGTRSMVHKGTSSRFKSSPIVEGEREGEGVGGGGGGE
ncbi:hypothetical protein C0995_003873 [Termitomyces sp. Mi166|nr:hypothetical protein C0995_003873 [Termitomyces sp. Mi166\